MKTPFTGGCSCGAVRYECTAAPEQIQMFKCHCRDCQRVTGGPYAPVVYMPAEAFRLLQGEIKHHYTQSEAMGHHRRGYCPQCGARLTGGEGPGAPGIGVTASSLDDPGQFQPAMEIFVSDLQPWDKLDPTLPAFPKYPPQ